LSRARIETGKGVPSLKAPRPDDAARSRREPDWRVDQAAYGARGGHPPYNRRDNDARKAIESS
jgi:hypothetical protein